MNLRSAVPTIMACFAFATPGIVDAQAAAADSHGYSSSVTAGSESPVYDSPAKNDRSTSARFGSTEDDARPGEYFFGLAVRGVKRKDYPFAISMYKVAASWAYKPAEYNLGVMFAQGIGTPQDLPRAMAWLTLAAERSDRRYVAARDLVNAKLDNAQFHQANVIFAQLLPTYGDASALVLAKARWAQVRASMTGSRVGSLAGNLKVGVIGSGMVDPGAAANPFRVDQTAGDILGGNQMDGAVAYRQLVSSKNPYDPKFARPLGHAEVTVQPLTPIKKGDPNRAGKSGEEPAENPPPV